MSGTNQHHIPQFLQRACGAKPPGKKPRTIWVHRFGVPPEEELISKTASEDYFYSEPAADGSKTLDDIITDGEQALASTCKGLRESSCGVPLDSKQAAYVVTELAPRSGHIRYALKDATTHFAAKAKDTFTHPDHLERLMGFDLDDPSDVFRDRFEEVKGEHPELVMFGLPPELLGRVAFRIAKEQFDTTLPEAVSFVATTLEKFAAGTAVAVRDSHNKSLSQMRERNVRRDLLEMFHWTIELAPEEGAILPDCVALVYHGEAEGLPFMFAGTDIEVAVMPLSRDRLLVGRRTPQVQFDRASYNREAAACSHQYFLAQSDDERFTNLSALVGIRTRTYFETATKAVFDNLLPGRATVTETIELEADTDHTLPGEADMQFDYQISCIGFVTEELAFEVVNGVKAVVSSMGRYLPLRRLDGITIASDYPSALREVDRGRSDLAPAETIDAEIGTGFAYTVHIIRDDEVKGRIVLASWVGEALVGDDEAERNTALSTLIHQLALVAMIELIERALPNSMLGPIGAGLQSALYSAVDSPLRGYVASYISAELGDPTGKEAAYRELLINALDRFKSRVEAERLAYRTHADLDRLLELATCEASYVLQFAADLLAIAAANGRGVLDGADNLKEALERSGLVYWLSDFGRDLERFRARLGRWNTHNEFLAFTRHTERLLWTVGMFPWESPTGPRIEIPLITDAVALAALEVPQ